MMFHSTTLWRKKKGVIEMDEREMPVEAGYDYEDVSQMTDEEVSEEISEIPYNL